MAKFGQMYFYDWNKEIDDFNKSGLNKAEFCKEKEYPETAFSYHYYKWKRTQQDNDKPKQAFAPVVVGQPSKDQTIAINGLSITVTENTDIGSLRTVLKALKEI